MSRTIVALTVATVIAVGAWLSAPSDRRRPCWVWGECPQYEGRR